MSNLSRTVINPRTGEKVTFLKTAEETNGEYLLFRTDLPPKNGIFSHYHTEIAESFEGIDGELELIVGGSKTFLKKGDKAFVPTGKIHRFWNPSDQLVSFTAELRPAGTFEQFVRCGYGLDMDGRSFYLPFLKQDIPKNILLLGTLFEMGEFYVPYIPRFLQKALFGLLAKLSKWTGSAKTLEKYYT